MDSFFGIGLFELVMIAIVALLVLGPERLPGAMREVAKWMRQLRSLSSEFQSQFSEEFKLLDDMNPRRIINEAIDPKTPSKPSPAQPPAKTLGAKPVAPASKPLASGSPATIPAVTPAATVFTVTNGEPQNTILPQKVDAPPEDDLPSQQEPDAAGMPAAAAGVEGEAEKLPPDAAPGDEQKLEGPR